MHNLVTIACIQVYICPDSSSPRQNNTLYSLKAVPWNKKTICMTQRNYNSTNKISNFSVTMNVTNVKQKV